MIPKYLKQWQLYFHYLLLAVGTIYGLIPLYAKYIGSESPLAMVAFSTVGFLVVDQLIHIGLRAFTGWKD